MVYVYTSQDELNSHIHTLTKKKTKLTVQEIKEALVDLGMDLKSDDDEPELKVEITAEKMDMITPVGIARAIAYYKKLITKAPQYTTKSSGKKVIVAKGTTVRAKTVAAIIKNAPMNEEFLTKIIDIQEKIHMSFGRDRKKAAIGIYPIENIDFPITYKNESPEKIKFQALDSDKELTAKEILSQHEKGKKYAHLLETEKKYPVFIDNNKQILSMPPIINAEQTGKVAAQHKDLFIECSGKNITHLDNILKVLTTTFADLGADIETIDVEYQDTNETYTLDLNPIEDSIDINMVNSLIGINIDVQQAKTLLHKMMYDIKETKGNIITVKIPAFRSDIWHDIDIADDIARAYGYNNIEMKFPTVAGVGTSLQETQAKDQIRQTLIELGFLETHSYILASTTTQIQQMNKDIKKESFISIADAQDQGINMLRTTILPETLTALAVNKRHKYPQKVFELNYVITANEKSETKAKDTLNVCTVIAGDKANYTEIKTVLDTIKELHTLDITLKESNEAQYIQGRQAHIYIGKEKVGIIGELHPQIISNFKLAVPIACFELSLK